MLCPPAQPLYVIFFFFFQAEDGIRDWSVTGVQTCALPISACGPLTSVHSTMAASTSATTPIPVTAVVQNGTSARVRSSQIGRASCRERVEISVVAVSLQEERRGDGTYAVASGSRWTRRYHE